MYPVRYRFGLHGSWPKGMLGLLKACGIQLGPVNAGYNRKDFRNQPRVTTKGDQGLQTIFASLVKVNKTICLKSQNWYENPAACQG